MRFFLALLAAATLTACTNPAAPIDRHLGPGCHLYAKDGAATITSWYETCPAPKYDTVWTQVTARDGDGNVLATITYRVEWD